MMLVIWKNYKQGAIIFGKDLDSCNTDDENEVELTDNSGMSIVFDQFTLKIEF